MTDDSNARQAITKLNGSDFLGKQLVVNEARPKTEGGGGGYRSGGSGGYNRRNY